MANRDLFPELFRLQQGINGIFDRFFSGPFEQSASFDRELPGFDVEEADNQFLLHLDLPGVKKENLKIDVQDNQLSISAERKSRRERSFGSFYRSFTLPAGVDPQKVEARFENGVLQIALPKVAASSIKQFQVPIQEGKLIEGSGSAKGSKSGKAA